jgi:hypothetical protein
LNSHSTTSSCFHPSLVQNPRAIEHPGTASRKAVQSYWRQKDTVHHIGRRHYRCGWRLEVCSFGYVKEEYGVSSCDSEVWWASHAFMRSDSFCPEYWVYSQRPSLLITVHNFAQWLVDIKMRVLYSSRVVSADPYMVEMVALWEILHHFEESWTVVSNNLAERSSPAKDIHIDPVS